MNFNFLFEMPSPERDKNMWQRRLELTFRAQDLVLLRDMKIINERTAKQLGPLPKGGISTQVKRKPKNLVMQSDITVPVPIALAERFKNYPEHLHYLQAMLNRLAEATMPGMAANARAVVILEAMLESFVNWARQDLDAAYTGGESQVIEQEQRKLEFMRQSQPLSNYDLSPLYVFIDEHIDRFE